MGERPPTEAASSSPFRQKGEGVVHTRGSLLQCPDRSGEVTPVDIEKGLKVGKAMEVAGPAQKDRIVEGSAKEVQDDSEVSRVAREVLVLGLGFSEENFPSLDLLLGGQVGTSVNGLKSFDEDVQEG
jgi:hypothetical protein